MKKIIFLLIFILVSSYISAFTIAEKGEAKCKVVLSQNATEAEKYACGEFISYIKKISGAELSVIDKKDKGNCVYIGGFEEKIQNLKSDGIYIKSDENSLILTGKGKSGAIYAVYTFLEDFLGVKYLTPEDEYIPHKQTIKVQNKEYSYSPSFYGREAWYKYNNDNPYYCLKMKLNGRYNLISPQLCDRPDSFGGGHTFQYILNPNQYGKEHPEWFSEINGERVVDHLTQLCLSNEEMTEKAIETVLSWVEENPSFDTFSVSQNDNDDFCTCDNCNKLYEKYGHSGAVLYFVNKVARAVNEKYPTKYVDTFAYAWSRNAPKGGIVPEKNVIIRLCSTHVDITKSFDQKENESFYRDLKDWGEISENIYVWDYIANFNNYVILHPDFHVLQKNLQIMKNNRVTQVFEQGDGSNDSNVLGDYKRYIVSKLLWNCDLDVLKETKTFMKYYYGSATGSMGEFLDYINSVAPNISARVEMNNYMANPYFTAENWIKSFELLNKAQKQAKKGKYYNRVKRDFLCLYAGYILSDLEIQEKVTASGVIPYKNITEGLNEMNNFLPAHGVRNYNEGMKWEEGIYANAIPKKQGTVPEICKDLKDEDWAEFQQDNLPVVFGGEDYGKIVDDSKASDGKAVWINPKYLDWYTQKSLSLFYYDKTLKSADIYATYRIDPLDKFGKIATCYIWNPVNKEILKYEFDYRGDADKEYKTVKIGEIDFQKTDSSSMLYFCGEGVPDLAKGFYLDRVIFVFHR